MLVKSVEHVKGHRGDIYAVEQTVEYFLGGSKARGKDLRFELVPVIKMDVLKDVLSLEKPSGRVFDNIHASVPQNRICGYRRVCAMSHHFATYAVNQKPTTLRSEGIWLLRYG